MLRSDRMVLVVEDDPDSCDLLARFLKRFGFDVRSAANAVEALAVLKSAPISVAIVDYHLPDHDGLWLLREMNDDPDLAGVSTVMFSGAFEHDVARRAFAEGAKEWLVKGVHSPSRVVETVERLHGPK
jgi:two-component system, NtrC family, nitrogen regulation response regulator NtrX